MSDAATINIAPDGELRFVYRDELRELLDAGRARVRRASDVEPGLPCPDRIDGIDGLVWTADLARGGGPVLGPFESRGEAIAAEVAWLESNLATIRPMRGDTEAER